MPPTLGRITHSTSGWPPMKLVMLNALGTCDFSPDVARCIQNRQLTYRTVRTQDFPDFWVLGGLRAIRTLLSVAPTGVAMPPQCWIWQSRPLRIKWQDWIALGCSASGVPPVAA